MKIFGELWFRFIAWLMEKNRKNKWNAKLQIEHARVIIESDYRWLASDPVASEICKRHLELLDDHWESIAFEDVSSLRQRLGLDPNSDEWRSRYSQLQAKQLREQKSS